VCLSCATPNDPANRFCFNCGTALVDPTSDTPSPREATVDPVRDAGERRLVSVVFADLVGFTTFSEHRDPEDVRSMLTRYYERCREIIDRHGGTTDKFIGDAVMGVWGAVAAHEDDAERATRAALELVDMVAGLGAELEIPELAARAGVLSGEASVGSGGNDQGLVVGDLVNTASRLQSIAEPGTVFVGETTKDLVGAAIEFKAFGDRNVKGKDLAVSVYQATRVVAISTPRRGGELAEGPFVGRDDELRLLKDQLHATGREGKARMVSIIGEGGIGKTRLSQELVRYIDGISEDIYYHNGRSPSYGEGVTFWALGEMIRKRAGIVEGEDATKSRLKLRTTVADFTPDDDDQKWIEPRLAAVIGLAPMPPGDRSELFGALRSFFQSVANRGTVLMVFEDLHWADDGLLDFIDELVERTTNHPILVVCLTRPELLERRPTWGSGRKRTLTMHLSRLDDDSMRVLIAGLAPGIPDPVVERIADRAAGVPLHAVEFVRMLLNTGQLVPRGDGFVFEGSADDLSIPDTVNAIIGARLDRLAPDELAIIQDAAVLGLTFTLTDVAGMRGLRTTEAEPVLRELVRREILEVDEDPRSPERGQYRFVQSLIREVAYGRLSKSERVSRHVAVAQRLEALDDIELAGVIASHYADAAAADPSNEALAEKARETVIGAADRAASLHSDRQAADLYRKAAQMTEDPVEAMGLRLELAWTLELATLTDDAVAAANEVLEWARERGDQNLEVRAVTTLAAVLAGNFEAEKAVELILPVYESTPRTDDEVWARLAAETSRSLMLADRPYEAIAVADTAIPVIEELDMIEDLLQTLVNKGSALGNAGRWMEGSAILRGVIDLADIHDLAAVRIRALNNLFSSTVNDNQVDRELIDEWAALIKRTGSMAWVQRMRFVIAEYSLSLGDIPDALAHVDEAMQEEISEFWVDNLDIIRLTAELMAGGMDDDTYRALEAVATKYLSTDDPQLIANVVYGILRYLLPAERYEDALSLSQRYIDVDIAYPSTLEGGILAAAMCRDIESLRDFHRRVVEGFPRGRACVGLAALSSALIAALDGDADTAIAEFTTADDIWVQVVTPVTVNLARAIFATTLGFDHPEAVAHAARSRHFFEEHDLRLYLEGIASGFPAELTADDVAV
jgi:class 3 adenylate cyclase/tetratricopeptide (TPR) repeat protein